MAAKAIADPTATIKDELTHDDGDVLPPCEHPTMLIAQIEEHELVRFLARRFPARRMSNELLAMTIEYLYDKEHSRLVGRPDWIPPFLQVCKAWRYVGERMSECWSRITIPPDSSPRMRELLELRIKRSANRGLSLSFDAPSVPSDAWELLVLHSSRWTYLSIGDAAQGFPLECAPIRLPGLEVVEIEFSQKAERSQPLSITLLNDAPSLSDMTLRLWDVSPVQQPPLLSPRWNLTELSVSVMTLPNYNQAACMSIIQFFSNTLEILRLLEGMSDDFEMSAEDIPPIKLPHVYLLRLERTCFKLLPLLAVPQLQSLRLDHTTFRADTVACVQRLANNSDGVPRLRYIEVDSSYRWLDNLGAPKEPNLFLALLGLHELSRVEDLVVTHYRDRPDKYYFDQDCIIHDLSFIRAMTASDDDHGPVLLPRLRSLSLAYFGAYPCSDSRGNDGDENRDGESDEDDKSEDNEDDEGEVDRDGFVTAHAMRVAIQEMAHSRSIRRRTRLGVTVKALKVYTDIPEWSPMLPPASP